MKDSDIYDTFYDEQTNSIKEYFDENLAVAKLLEEELVAWHPGIESAMLSVKCSDVFGPGCADSEPLPFEDIKNLYLLYKEYSHYGMNIWVILRRNQRPWSRVEELMKCHNAWPTEMYMLPEREG